MIPTSPHETPRSRGGPGPPNNPCTGLASLASEGEGFVVERRWEQAMNEVAYPKKVKLLSIAIGALVFVLLGFYFAQNRVAMGLPPVGHRCHLSCRHSFLRSVLGLCNLPAVDA